LARFEFRLATLLKLRRAQRDRCRQSLAEAQRAQEVLRAQSGELDRQLVALRAEVEAATRPGPLHVDRLLESQRYELIVQAQQQQLAEKCQVLKTELERRRVVLVEADRQVKVLEKLEQRQSERHHAEGQRRLWRELDEIAARSGKEH